MIVKFRPIKSKLNLPFKIAKLLLKLQLLLATTSVEIMLVVYAMHGGQGLKHPLITGASSDYNLIMIYCDYDQLLYFSGI